MYSQAAVNVRPTSCFTTATTPGLPVFRSAQGEFAHMLRWSDDLHKARDAATVASGFLTISPVDPEQVMLVPRGEEAIKQTWLRLEEEALRQAEEELQEYREVERERARELEREEEAQDRAAGRGPNPEIREGLARYDFTTQKLPKNVATHGFVDYRPQPDGSHALYVGPKSHLTVKLPSLFGPNGGGCLRMNEYTIALELRLPSLPPVASGLVRTSPPTSKRPGAEFAADSGGRLGVGANLDDMYGQVEPQRWHHLIISVACGRQVTFYLNGQEYVPYMIPDDLDIDGPISVDLLSGLSLFGSAEEPLMTGGLLRTVTVYNRALASAELEVAHHEFKEINEWQCAGCTSLALWDVLRCPVCDMPRPLPGGEAAGDPAVEMLRRVQAMGFPATGEQVAEAIAQGGDNDELVMMHILSHFLGD